MRNLRNIALAGATAVALTFGSTSVAIAEDANAQTQQSSQQGATDTPKPGLSSWVGQNIFGIGEHGGKGDKTDAQQIFGSSKNWADASTAGKRLYVFSVVLGITAILALLIAPIDNFIKYGPHAK